MFHLTKKRAVAMAVVGSLALSAGAYAYFTSTGTGSGSATVGQSAPFTVSTAAPTGGPLTPGGPFETVAYTVTNGSSGDQLLTNITVSVANPDGSEWIAVPGCSKNDFSVNGAADGATYLDTENAGNTPAGAIRNNTVTIQMVNDPLRSQNACQGVSVPLYLSAS
jgi:hypothetical protein